MTDGSDDCAEDKARLSRDCVVRVNTVKLGLTNSIQSIATTSFNHTVYLICLPHPTIDRFFNNKLLLISGAGYNFSNEEIAAQSFVFILAGSETTSATLSFCLYELALNPAVLQKLLTEVDSMTSISYESVSSLQYLEMVIDGWFELL